jgi:hypothetical protein
MSALREVAAVFGIQFDHEALDRGQASIGGAVTALRSFGAMLAGSAIAVGLKELVSDVVEASSALQDASDRLGVTTDELQQLQYAAGQAGVGAQQLNAALTGLSQRHPGRPVVELMDELAERFDRIADPAERVRLATQEFGGAGRRLVGILHSGAGGLAEMRARLRDFGGGMTTEAIGKADDLGDSFDNMRTAMLSIKSVLVVDVLAPLARLVNSTARTIGGFARWVRETHAVERAMRFLASTAAATGVVLGALFANRLIPLIQRALPLIRTFIAQGARFAVTWGLPIVAIVALGLALEDLWVLFHGGNSAIGTFLDRMYGVGAAQRFVNVLKEAWADLGIVFDDALAALGNVWNSLTSGVAAAWNSLSSLAPQLEEAFTSAWDAIDNALGGALTRGWQAIVGFVQRIGQTMGRVAQAIAHPFEGAWQAISESLHDVNGQWGELLGGGPPGARSGPVLSTAAAHGAARSTTHIDNRRVNAPITINSNNPEEVARRVSQHINRQNSTHADSAHPLVQRES